MRSIGQCRNRCPQSAAGEGARARAAVCDVRERPPEKEPCPMSRPRVRIHRKRRPGWDRRTSVALILSLLWQIYLPRRISMEPLLLVNCIGHAPFPILPLSESPLTIPETIIGSSELILPK